MKDWRRELERLLKSRGVKADAQQRALLESQVSYFAHERIADKAASRGDVDAAMRAYRDALGFAEASGDADLLAGCWSSIGSLHMRVKEYSAAATAYEKALPYSRATGNQHGLAVCLRNLAEAKRYLARSAEALVHATESLSLYSALGNREGVAAATRARARSLEDLGRRDEALKAYTEASTLYESLPGKDEAVATCSHRIGVILCATQGGASARDYLFLALKAARDANQPSFAVDVLNDLAMSHAMDGDYQTALRHFLDVLSEARRLPDAQGAVAVCLNNLGRISLQQHDPARARHYFEEAIALGRRGNHKTQLITPLANLGRVHELAGQWGRALELYREALEVAREFSQLALTAFSCCSIGRTLSSMGRHEEALSALAEGAKLADRIGDRRQASELLCNIAVVHLRRADHGAAAAKAAEACQLAREHGERDTLQAFLAVLGKALIRLGRRGEAKAALEEAVAILETLRAASAPDRQAQLRSFDSDVATHRLLIEDILLPGGEIDRAFEVLECAKSRLLWDLLVDRQVIQTHRQDSAAAERIERLAERRRGLEFLLGDRNPGQEAAAREWISEYEEIGKELRAIALQAVDDGNDVDEQLVCSTQDVREVLPNRTALVEFFVGRDGVVAFLLDHSGKWRLVKLPACTPAVVRRWADELGRSSSAAVAAGHWEPFMATMDEIMPEVYDRCVREVARHLSGDTEHVIIVPHQELHRIPFHAAFHVADGRRVYWLEEGRTISYAPSSSFLRSCCRRARPAPTRLVAVANPTLDLPASELEVARVAALYSSATLLGAGGDRPATRSEMISAARAAHIVLCTGHGRRGTIESAALALADGELSIRDQYVELHLPLCTLWDSDCCEGAIPDVRGADDWITLSSAPLVAGARTVWSTLWAVDDGATAALKIAAYDALANEGASPARALNAAQRAALAGDLEWFADSEANRHPAFWGPFISVGAP